MVEFIHDIVRDIAGYHADRTRYIFSLDNRAVATVIGVRRSY